MQGSKWHIFWSAKSTKKRKYPSGLIYLCAFKTSFEPLLLQVGQDDMEPDMELAAPEVTSRPSERHRRAWHPGAPQRSTRPNIPNVATLAAVVRSAGYFLNDRMLLALMMALAISSVLTRLVIACSRIT